MEVEGDVAVELAVRILNTGSLAHLNIIRQKKWECGKWVFLIQSLSREEQG